MQFLYNFSVRLYGLAIRLAAPFHAKANLWVSGRKNWQTRLQQATLHKKDWIWFHCASLGEFEQGRPLIEKIRQEQPEKPILITFYSPSGYEIRKNYSGADHICYLPLDTQENAEAFLNIVQPSAVFFIKYEIWVNFLVEMKARNIPVFLVSAMVRENSRFFRGLLKNVFRKGFLSFSWIFAQTPEVAKILSSFLGHDRISVSGDTRFDRTVEIKNQFQPIPEMENFLEEDDFCVVCGSTWPKDEEIILKVSEKLKAMPIKWIIAPHEINRIRLISVVAKHPYEMITWSAIEKCDPTFKMLWIDNIGMLSKLYHFGSMAYLGGGFGKGIHNVLEATAYGCPVVFGPKYKKFHEAVSLVEIGGGLPIQSADQLEEIVLRLFANHEALKSLQQKNLAFMQENLGATEVILQKVRELNRL